jgi:glycosyltransferase involved in cell wall biosynthesis
MICLCAIPVYNEEQQLEASVLRCLEWVASDPVPGLTWRLAIIDNGSTDRTWSIATDLAGRFEAVRAVRLNRKGRGAALKHAWTELPADLLMYMDVDLSTDLACISGLMGPLIRGAADIAIGTRLHRESRVVRGWRREVISRCYNSLIQLLFRAGFSDAQCGFKAITASAAAKLVPQIEDNEWFFDTELLLVAERLGFRIFELPVRWTDDPDSRVKIIETAWKDLRGLYRLKRRFAAEEKDMGGLCNSR